MQNIIFLFHLGHWLYDTIKDRTIVIAVIMNHGIIKNSNYEFIRIET